MDAIRIYDRFPLIVIEFSGAPNDAQFADYLARMDALGQELKAKHAHLKQPIVTLLDTSQSTRPVSAKQRKMQTDYMQKHEKELDDATASLNAICFVITNPLVRGVLTALLWIKPIREQHVVVASRAEAEAWCTRWLAENNRRLQPARASVPPPSH